MKRVIFIYLWCLVFAACTSVSPLEKALQLSGNNRVQLEQVLRHYSRDPADSLKYKAACFLIENMPGHGWYEGEELEKYKRWIDSAFQTEKILFRYSLYEAFFQQPDAVDGLTRYEEIEQLDSNFLITHIDSTFSAIRKRPWLDALSFEQLCEYILPYRVENERPQLLFNLQDSIFKTIVTEYVNYDDMGKDARNIFGYTMLNNYKKERIVKIEYRNRIIEYELYGCVHLAVENKWKGRLLLCPVAIDLNPAFPNRNDRHCWTIMVNNSEMNGITKISYELDKLGKIYRKTFVRQSHPQSNPTTSEFIPPFFRSPFYKDVTSSYSSVQDIVIRPFVPVNTSYGYLCVFNDLKWEPVAYAEYKAGQFRFKDVGRGVVYLPVVYPDVDPVTVSYPFILKLDGQITTLKPDTTHLISLKLTRKYPLSYKTIQSNRWFANTVIEASNRADFKQKEAMGTFGKVSLQQYTSAPINSSCKYRYWKIISNGYTTIGECFMYDKNGKKVVPILQKQGHPMPYSTAFDDDPITYTHSENQGDLIFDMGEPVALSQVECLLRNDGNDVWPGHWYELNYYDGKGWYSLGIQEAKERYVEFSGVPENALLWLKDLTTGRQERIFTYKNGQVYFW